MRKRPHQAVQGTPRHRGPQNTPSPTARASHGCCKGLASVQSLPRANLICGADAPLPAAREAGWARASLLFCGRRQELLTGKETADRCRPESTASVPGASSSHKGLLGTSPCLVALTVYRCCLLQFGATPALLSLPRPHCQHGKRALSGLCCPRVLVSFCK